MQSKIILILEKNTKKEFYEDKYKLFKLNNLLKYTDFSIENYIQKYDYN